MKRRPLSETNPHLKSLAKRRELVARSIRTSFGVEGIKINPSSKSVKIEISRRKHKKIYERIKLSVQAKQ